ncbi:MAG: Glucosamine-6-phosphate deaminase 1 [Elusimicrobia bacterium ADurb.Bin231]|nr:MAG: Glucosamine-6-phosphate deaminase 1 [Elusimicrobia bacterium ADurb.Bin231]
MKVFIRKNYDEMSRYAAEIIVDLIKTKPNCVIGLATGGTPIGTYRELADFHRKGLDMSKVKTFNLDEYLGIGIDMKKSYESDQSYARFMYEELFKHVNIKKENIHIPNGLSKNPDKFCQWYEDEIKKAGGIDLQILGIGGNGHWAFNEPGASLYSRTRVEPLTKQTLDDNYDAFYKKAGIKRDKMPHFAITMGIGTILEARNLLMIANGKKKAKVVARALEGSVTSQVTASAIQLHSGESMVVLDKEASTELKNIEHYKHVEKILSIRSKNNQKISSDSSTV